MTIMKEGVYYDNFIHDHSNHYRNMGVRKYVGISEYDLGCDQKKKTEMNNTRNKKKAK